MEKRKLGNSDLEITPIGFGAWAIGGAGWSFGWGKQDDRKSIAAIKKAVELGINWIDTAAVYGLGHSEEITAEALKDINNKPYIFTKCERTWDENKEIVPKLKAESIRKECEESLRRLKTDVIDLYQIHWPEPDEDIEEGWETMTKLKEEGKVRWIGVSNFNVNQMKRAMNIEPVTSLQPPYSLSKPEVEKEILPYCKENNIGVIAYSPMMSGLLSGKMTRERVLSLPDDDWRKKSSEFSEPKLTRNLKIADKLKAIGEKYNVSAGTAAIAWTLRNPAVTGAIVGARNPEQVENIFDAMTFRLSEEEVKELSLI